MTGNEVNSFMCSQPLGELRISASPAIATMIGGIVFMIWSMSANLSATLS